MLQQSKPQRTREEMVRFPGIVADARELGVSRVTLYRVLSNYPGWDLKKLKARYVALKEKQEAGK
jgi:hypothetical protein